MRIRRSIASPALRAGTVLAMAAGALVGIASPAFATAVSATVAPTKGPIAGTNTITITAGATPPAAFATTNTIWFSGTTCATAAPTTGGVSTTGSNITVVDATHETVVVPNLSTAKAWFVCVYAATTPLAATGTAAYTSQAPQTSMTLAPAGGAVTLASATSITATDTNSAFTAGTTVEFETGSCATTYSSATTAVPATVTGNTATTLTITVPAGLAGATGYFVCAYTGSTAGTSALMSGTATAAFSTLGVTPARAAAGVSSTLSLSDPNASPAFSAATGVQLSTGPCAGTYQSSGVVQATVTAYTNTTLTVTVPSSITANTWYVCVYAGTSGTSALETGTSATAFSTATATTMSAVTPNIGVPDGGITVTATDVNNTFIANTPVEFESAGTCASTYQTASTGNVITAVGTSSSTSTFSQLSIVQPAMPAGTYALCAYSGVTPGTSPLISKYESPGFTVYGVLTLNTNNGSSAGGNTISATTNGGTFFTGTAVVFVHSAATCPASYAVGVGDLASPDVKIPSATKLAIKVPGGVSTNTYAVCAYTDAVSGPLIAGTSVVAGQANVLSYTAATPATVSTVSPTSGPAQGGTTITVTGSHFTGITAASIGGAALTNIRVINSGAGFTATTSAHAAGGPFALTVTTAGGTVTKVSAFTYQNGVTVTPNLASSNAPVDVEVFGSGFQSIQFIATTGSTWESANGHVYLVRGTYDPRQLITSGFKLNGEVLECTDVLVISDTDLVCTMYLDGTGTRPAMHADAALAAATMSPGSDILTFTDDLTGGGGTLLAPTDVGMTVTGNGIPDGTTILKVLSDTTGGGRLQLSAANTGGTGGTGVTATANLWAPKSPAGNTFSATTNPTTITNGAATFYATDIGRNVTGVGIQPGTVITGTATNHLTATLSLPVTANNTGGVGGEALTIGNPVVPDGNYTITVVSDGMPQPDPGGPLYTQSVVSGGSSFTVAAF